MISRQEYEIAMILAIRRNGLVPIRAVYDAAGRCLSCKHPEALCVGWHSSRFEVKKALADLGLK